MSYSSLKQLAHGLVLLVLQRWSIWLLRVGVEAEKMVVGVAVLEATAQAQDYL